MADSDRKLFMVATFKSPSFTFSCALAWSYKEPVALSL